MTRFIHLANGHATRTVAVVPNGEADAPPSSAATPRPAGIPSLPAGRGRPSFTDKCGAAQGCDSAPSAATTSGTTNPAGSPVARRAGDPLSFVCVVVAWLGVVLASACYARLEAVL